MQHERVGTKLIHKNGINILECISYKNNIIVGVMWDNNPEHITICTWTNFNKRGLKHPLAVEADKPENLLGKSFPHINGLDFMKIVKVNTLTDIDFIWNDDETLLTKGKTLSSIKHSEHNSPLFDVQKNIGRTITKNDGDVIKIIHIENYKEILVSFNGDDLNFTKTTLHAFNMGEVVRHNTPIERKNESRINKTFTRKIGLSDIENYEEVNSQYLESNRIGLETIHKKLGYKITVISYISHREVYYMIDENFNYVTKDNWFAFLEGSVEIENINKKPMPIVAIKKERIGTIIPHTNGINKLECVAYTNNADILVMWDDNPNLLTKTEWDVFNKGKLTHPEILAERYTDNLIGRQYAHKNGIDTMTIIKANNTSDIDFIWNDDETNITKSVQLPRIKQSYYTNPLTKTAHNCKKDDRLFKQLITKDGWLIVVVEYDGGNATFLFSDGMELKAKYKPSFDTELCSLQHPLKHINLVGQTNTTNDGLICEIVDAKAKSDIIIKFEDGVTFSTRYPEFKKGKIRHPTKFSDRLGEKTLTNYGEECEIVEYNNATDIKVRFTDDGTIIKTGYYSFKTKQGKCLLANPNSIHYNQISLPEKEITDYLLSKGVYLDTKNKSILGGNFEVDIFAPIQNIAIEYNGLYWHSNKFKDNNYHITKTKLCREKDINLIHIFEDEWLKKKDVVKSRLLSIFGKSGNIIYARKCIIKEIDYTTSKNFLNETHLQGAVKSLHHIGLFYEDELVSVMCFSELSKYNGLTPQNNHFELSRFASKLNTNVVGAASKLIKYFERTYSPEYLISYADRRWGVGEMYQTLGFSFSHLSPPNYTYLEQYKIGRKHKYTLNKTNLAKMGCDISKTEAVLTAELGYLKIYDCGKIMYFKDYSGNEQIPYTETKAKGKPKNVKTAEVRIGDKTYKACEEKVAESLDLLDDEKLSKLMESPRFREIDENKKTIKYKKPKVKPSKTIQVIIGDKLYISCEEKSKESETLPIHEKLNKLMESPRFREIEVITL